MSSLVFDRASLSGGTTQSILLASTRYFTPEYQDTSSFSWESGSCPFELTSQQQRELARKEREEQFEGRKKRPLLEEEMRIEEQSAHAIRRAIKRGAERKRREETKCSICREEVMFFEQAWISAFTSSEIIQDVHRCGANGLHLSCMACYEKILDHSKSCMECITSSRCLVCDIGDTKRAFSCGQQF